MSKYIYYGIAALVVGGVAYLYFRKPVANASPTKHDDVGAGFGIGSFDPVGAGIGMGYYIDSAVNQPARIN